MTCEEVIEMMEGYQLVDAVDRAEWDAFQMAIEAIEKQIPKKPTGYDECSVCGTFVFIRDRYCPRCGQAIDWSE